MEPGISNLRMSLGSFDENNYMFTFLLSLSLIVAICTTRSTYDILHVPVLSLKSRKTRSIYETGICVEVQSFIEANDDSDNHRLQFCADGQKKSIKSLVDADGIRGWKERLKLAESQFNHNRAIICGFVPPANCP